MKRVLAVASGKGGVGKTWFAVSLGQALARMNRRVLLVDCDLGLANVDVQLGLDRTVDIMHVVAGDVPLSSAIQSADRSGLDVLPGRSGAGYLGHLDPMMVGWLQRELRSMCDVYDVVIMDLPSGIDQGVRDVMRHADEEVIITTSEPTALTDAYALIKATRKNRPDHVPKIVVNFADDAKGGRQTLEGLVRVCDRFLSIRPMELGIIRRDRRVPEAIARQTALFQCYPGSDAARDVATIAEALIASKVPA